MRKSDSLWTVLAVVSVVLSFIFLVYGFWFFYVSFQDLTSVPSEENAVFLPFVNETFSADHSYYRIEYDAIDEPFELEFGAESIPVKAGRRVVYAMGDDVPAFKLHAEIANTDFESFESGYRMNLVFPDVDVSGWKYKGHSLRLLSEVKLTPNVYRGSVAVGIIFFPETDLVVTIYFFDTEYYGESLPDFAQVMEKFVDNVV